MAFFNWSDERFSVHIQEIDEQHKMLISYLDELYDAMQKGEAHKILKPLLKKLVGYAQTHFATEEYYFRIFDYPESQKHEAEHDAFVEKVRKFQDDFNAGKAMLSIEIADFLRNWISEHISIEDKKYSAFLNSKGVK
ncbi:hemerythrin family protein [bacterium]|nr:hemerythrin family protein [bacterium]